MRTHHPQYIRAALMVCMTLLQITGILLVTTSCRSKEPPPAERMWTTMGTFASVTLRGSDAARLAHYHKITAKSFETVNQTLSVWQPDSEISQLNHANNTLVSCHASSVGFMCRTCLSGIPEGACLRGLPLSRENHALQHLTVDTTLAVSKLTHDALRAASRYAALTGGAFDPTIAPLIRLWGFSGGTTPSNHPTAKAIAHVRRNTGYRHLVLTDNPPRAGFERPGVSVDLGGIAKGYAVDRAYNQLQTNAPAPALLNLGGNIRCLGTATPQRPWRIGVRHPFDQKRILGFLQLPDGMAVATSGNYERFVTIDGKRYAHIIDPRSGLPVQGMAGVTTLSATATAADAMSTALFVAGLESAPALLKKLPDCEALLVPDRRPVEIWVSPGFDSVFTPSPQYAGSVKRLADYRNL